MLTQNGDTKGREIVQRCLPNKQMLSSETGGHEVWMAWSENDGESFQTGQTR